jgi:hypothetical protein
LECCNKTPHKLQTHAALHNIYLQSEAELLRVNVIEMVSVMQLLEVNIVTETDLTAAVAVSFN